MIRIADSWHAIWSWVPSRHRCRAVPLALLGVACGSQAAPAPAQAARAGTTGAPHAGVSRCDDANRADREVTESRAKGALSSSILRVYRVIGQGEQRRRILICREVDTNLDGVKDLVRRYNAAGESLEERADADYDGVIDTWIRFDKGRVARVDIDTAWDGEPDESRFYANGKLLRIERDTNGDGKSDVWEIYAAGRLTRMGVDLDHDGRVDRWERDTELNAGAAQQAEHKAATGAENLPIRQ